MELGSRTPAAALLDSYGACSAISRGIGAYFETVDMLLLPSTARVSWPLGELNQDDGSIDPDAWVRLLLDEYCPFTAMFNVTGQPAISLPLAWTDAGFPSVSSLSAGSPTRRRSSGSPASSKPPSPGRVASARLGERLNCPLKARPRERLSRALVLTERAASDDDVYKMYAESRRLGSRGHTDRHEPAVKFLLSGTFRHRPARGEIADVTGGQEVGSSNLPSPTTE